MEVISTQNASHAKVLEPVAIHDHVNNDFQGGREVLLLPLSKGIMVSGEAACLGSL